MSITIAPVTERRLLGIGRAAHVPFVCLDSAAGSARGSRDLPRIEES